MGGDISIKNEHGKGTSFNISIGTFLRVNKQDLMEFKVDKYQAN